jgi:hypothetical protein
VLTPGAAEREAAKVRAGGFAANEEIATIGIPTAKMATATIAEMLFFFIARSKTGRSIYCRMPFLISENQHASKGACISASPETICMLSWSISAPEK